MQNFHLYTHKYLVIFLNSIFSLIMLVGKYIPIDMSERERAELSAERQRMTEEMEGMSKQRETLEQERAEFIEDRKRLNEEKSQLQMRINDSEKVFIFVLLRGSLLYTLESAGTVAVV